jgi:hypothetical protein
MGIRDDQEAPRAEVELARVADLNRLAVQVAGLGEVASGFAELMTMARLFADPQALQANMDAFAARDCKSRDLEASAKRAVVAMNNREAEIDAAQAALDEREREIAATEGRWRERVASVELRETRVSETGQLAEMRKLKRDIERHETWLRSQLLNISGLGSHYHGTLQGMPDFAAVVAEIMSDHGIAPDGAASERIESPTADETVFQNDLPMRTPAVASGKSPRHRAEPRV